MFGKKKTTPESVVDYNYRKKWEEIGEGRDRLIACVERSIIRNQCVALYPVGPDKAKAEEDAECAKRLLLCAVGYYDGRMQELRDLWKRDHEKLEKCATWSPDRWSTSHEIIEHAVRNFFRR